MTTIPSADVLDVAALYRQHHLALVRLAIQLVDDFETAEDVVHDVFAGMQSRSVPQDAQRYLRAAVVNRSRSVLRRRRTMRAFGRRRMVLSDGEPADSALLRDESNRAVLDEIDTLPRRQREVVVLRYYEELAIGEIAAVLGIRPGAVSTALSRALATLSERLEGGR